MADANDDRNEVRTVLDQLLAIQPDSATRLEAKAMFREMVQSVKTDRPFDSHKQFRPEMRLHDDLGIDSLCKLEMLGMLERRIGAVSDELVATFQSFLTVREATDLIAKLLQRHKDNGRFF